MHPSAIDRWSDFIGQDRDSPHLGTLSILQHFTHTMKPSDPLMLAISRHLATPGFPRSPDLKTSQPKWHQGAREELAVKKSLTIGIEWETTVTKRLSNYNVASIQKPQEGARRVLSIN